jgi:hypothetical protein
MLRWSRPLSLPPKPVHNTSEGRRHGGQPYIPRVEFEHLVHVVVLLASTVKSFFVRCAKSRVCRTYFVNDIGERFEIVDCESNKNDVSFDVIKGAKALRKSRKRAYAVLEIKFTKPQTPRWCFNVAMLVSMAAEKGIHTKPPIILALPFDHLIPHRRYDFRGGKSKIWRDSIKLLNWFYINHLVKYCPCLCHGYASIHTSMKNKMYMAHIVKIPIDQRVTQRRLSTSGWWTKKYG